MKHAIKHIHFVGVGGAGMSGIAEVLRNLGYAVSGSDLSDSTTLKRLQTLGIHTFVGHDANHIAGADCVLTKPCLPDALRDAVVALWKSHTEAASSSDGAAS